MRGGRRVYIAAVLAVLGAIGLLAPVLLKDAGPKARFGSPNGSRAEPEVLLHDVEMQEIRKDGTPYRIFAERATYRLQSGRFSGSVVTLEVSGRNGETVVRAPNASWDMPAGQVFLPEGGTAEDGAGWSAAVLSAKFSLRERVLKAPGKARLIGPGLSVTGDNLVWNLREGTWALQEPKTRLEPSRVSRKRG